MTSPLRPEQLWDRLINLYDGCLGSIRLSKTAAGREDDKSIESSGEVNDSLSSASTLLYIVMA